jgi:hypothetical protein
MAGQVMQGQMTPVVQTLIASYPEIRVVTSRPIATAACVLPGGGAWLTCAGNRNRSRNSPWRSATGSDPRSTPVSWNNDARNKPACKSPPAASAGLGPSRA